MWVHHPGIAREFEEKTKSITALPGHVKKKKRKDEGPPRPKGYS